jgi:replicative DNA helicase
LQDNIATKELENINVGKQIKNYLKSIEESASAPAIKTGFDEFDSSLGGGLRAGRLYGIGGITSLGKTTFALQIADNIAQKRQDVLIFSLEMDRQEMISKSISRRTFSLNKKDKNKAISPQDILDPVKRKEHLDILAEAVGDYSTHWAKQVNIAEGVGDIGVKEIRRSVDNFLVKKGSRPVVFIDYLQILAPYNERLSDKQNIDKSVLELKRIARDYQIPVIAINSFNRSNYLSEASFEAFKESGAIEYSCDVLIALQLKIDGRDKWTESSPSLNEKRNKINEAKIASPREVEAIILKNRGYKAYAKITFRYLPEYDYFEENSSNF